MTNAMGGIRGGIPVISDDRRGERTEIERKNLGLSRNAEQRTGGNMRRNFLLMPKGCRKTGRVMASAANSAAQTAPSPDLVLCDAFMIIMSVLFCEFPFVDAGFKNLLF
jgi:hypothetical protein